jgi:hypothetical protein
MEKRVRRLCERVIEHNRKTLIIVSSNDVKLSEEELISLKNSVMNDFYAGGDYYTPEEKDILQYLLLRLAYRETVKS